MIADALKQKWSQKHLSDFHIFLDTQSAKKSRVRECSFFGTDNTNLPESTIVPRVTSFFNEFANTLALSTTSSSKPSRRNSPLLQLPPNITVSRMNHYRQSLVEHGISERDSELILLSRRKSTNSNYSSSVISAQAGVINRKFIRFEML